MAAPDSIRAGPISQSLAVLSIMSTPQYEKPAPMTYESCQRAEERHWSPFEIFSNGTVAFLVRSMSLASADEALFSLADSCLNLILTPSASYLLLKHQILVISALLKRSSSIERIDSATFSQRTPTTLNSTTLTCCSRMYSILRRSSFIKMKMRKRCVLKG